jgi:cupin 2 domain-containing protein
MSGAPATGNLLRDVPERLAEEQFRDLVAAPGLRITRIVSTGQSTAWQEPCEDEFVLVLTGSGTLRFAADDRLLTLGPGDWCHIPAGVRHRVEGTDPDRPTVWLAVHFGGPEERE